MAMAIPYQLLNRLKTSSSSPEIKNTSNLSILLNKPFWIWDKQEHRPLYLETNGVCCFNHIIGLPQKDKKQHALYDYEQLLYDRLFSIDKDFKVKHLWVLKSTGLGVTEFFLRIIGWVCTKDDTLKNSQVCIVTGPDEELSITLINRLKAIFYSRLGISFPQ